MLNIILTFDYEIFFGDNISGYDNVLFKPTSEIMNMLDLNDIKATFFIDTLSYYKNLEIGNTEYCEKFKQQCIDMLKRGHDIQLHIHAHWLTARYDKNLNMWISDYKKYRIQEYNDAEIDNAIQNSIKFLNDCALEAKVKYKCTTFRAGGLTLFPENKLISKLVNNGIKYDSSIARYTYSDIEYANYDYRNVPDKLNWYISANKGINFDYKSDESVFEVPVATIRNSIFRLLFLKKPLRITNSNLGGKSFPRPNNKKSIINKLIKKFYGYNWVTLDTRSYNVIYSDLKTIYKKYNCNSNKYTIAIIGHPKMMNTRNVENMGKLIELVIKDHERFNFINFNNI